MQLRHCDGASVVHRLVVIFEYRLGELSSCIGHDDRGQNELYEDESHAKYYNLLSPALPIQCICFGVPGDVRQPDRARDGTTLIHYL